MAITPDREATSQAGPDDARLIVDAARSAISQEFQVAERLDAKARNQVAVGAGWFALVQGIAAIAIKQQLDSRTNVWFSVLIAIAVVGGLALGLSIFFSYQVWKLRDEQEITHESLEQMAAVSKGGEVELVDELAKHYGFILWTRRQNNADRASDFSNSVTPWVLGLLAGLAELIVALVALATAA